MTTCYNGIVAIYYMLINLNEAIEKAKKNGATENPGLVITVRLQPRWITWILNKIYPKGCLHAWIEYGEIEDGSIWSKGSVWTSENNIEL